MTTLKTEEKQNVQEKEPRDGFPIGSRMPLLFLGMLIISIAGNFVFRDHWVEVIINHLGGLSIVGLFACLAGFIAKKKGNDYSKAFLLGFFLPIVLGIVAFSLAFFSADMIYCGGGVVLAASLLIVIIYSFTKKRDVSKQAELEVT
ncbi:hypothetical protein ACFL4T_03230 [candidate division KSB1 bacterium]